MKIHNFNPETAEYISTTEAAPDPMTEGRFLIPMYATELEPPESQENKARILENDEWKYVTDYRGTKVEATDGSGRSMVIDKLGLEPSDITFTPMPVEPEPVAGTVVSETTEYTMEQKVDAILRFLATQENATQEIKNLANAD